MKTHMLLRKIYSWRIALFALAIIFTSVVVPLSGLGSSTVNAATLQECYDRYNNKDVQDPNNTLSNDCINLGCKYNEPIQGKISCPDPKALPDDVVKKAADAEVKPLQTAVCGEPGIGDTSIRIYTECADRVRTAYTACDNVIIPIQGPVEDTDANTAKCVRDRLPNPKPVLADFVSAVRAGRNAAKGIVDEAKNAAANQQNKEKCEADGGTWENSQCIPEDKETCAVDGIGWIVCPAILFITKLNDAAFGFLNNFLEVPARVFNDPATRLAWEAFRNFGNVAFVIAFLVIIYSQLTGAGVSNYGVKKLLPKLIIAAVFVNISFYICGILVDLSNIVGGSLYDLLKNFKVGDAPEASTLNSIWTAAGAVILGAGAVAGLIALIIFAPTSLLAFAVVIIILIARQGFIILLIVISPLAFVAYLLPNTEAWFKKWWKAFTGVLLVYPIIALIFGASTLAANILLSVSQGGGDDAEMMKIVAAGIMGSSLLAVPPALKAAVVAAGAAGGVISGLQDRANRRTSRGVKEGRIGEARTAFGARRQVAKLNRRRGEGRIASFAQAREGVGGKKGKAYSILGKLATTQKRFDESTAGQYFGGNRGAAAATSGLFKESGEEIGRQKTLTSGRSNESLIEDIVSGKGSEEYQAAIAGTVMSRGHRASHLQVMKIMDDKMRAATASGDTKEQERLSTVQKQMYHDMKDKPFGVSDSVLSKLEEGTMGQMKDPTDPTGQRMVAETGGDIFQDTQKRIETKLTEEKLAHMNPDDARIVYELARNKHLSAPQRDNLVKTIKAARKGRYQGDIKPEVAAMHQEILDYYEKGQAFSTGNTHKSHGVLPTGYHP